MYYTQKEKLAYIRLYCKEKGLVFRQVDSYINNKPAYAIFNKQSGKKLTNNMTVDIAFDSQDNTSFIDSL